MTRTGKLNETENNKIIHKIFKPKQVEGWYRLKSLEDFLDTEQISDTLEKI